MNTELTILLELEIVEQAHAYARQTGQELGTLLADYVAQLARKNRPLPELPPAIQALRGSIFLPPGVEYKQVLAEELAKKYDV